MLENNHNLSPDIRTKKNDQFVFADRRQGSVQHRRQNYGACSITCPLRKREYSRIYNVLEKDNNEEEWRQTWIHCENGNRAKLVQLAIAHQLHPLLVQEAMKISVNVGPRIRTIDDGGTIIVLPLIYLTEKSTALVEHLNTSGHNIREIQRRKARKRHIPSYNTFLKFFNMHKQNVDIQTTCLTGSDTGSAYKSESRRNSNNIEKFTSFQSRYDLEVNQELGLNYSRTNSTSPISRLCCPDYDRDKIEKLTTTPTHKESTFLSKIFNYKKNHELTKISNIELTETDLYGTNFNLGHFAENHTSYKNIPFYKVAAFEESLIPKCKELETKEEIKSTPDSFNESECHRFSTHNSKKYSSYKDRVKSNSFQSHTTQNRYLSQERKPNLAYNFIPESKNIFEEMERDISVGTTGTLYQRLDKKYSKDSLCPAFISKTINSNNRRRFFLDQLAQNDPKKAPWDDCRIASKIAGGSLPLEAEVVLGRVAIIVNRKQNTLITFVKTGDRNDQLFGSLSEIAAQLNLPSSFARRSLSRSWLLYVILNTIAEQWVPVLQAYRLRIQWFEDALHWGLKEGEWVSDELSMSLVKEILLTKQAVDEFQITLRPVLRVVKHIGLDPMLGGSTEVRRYMEDVEDQVLELIEQGIQLHNFAESLVDECSALQERKHNRRLYYLSMLSVLYVPVQFLTGFYGMNFIDSDGVTSIPMLGQLTYENAWWQFWGLGVILTIGLWWLFKRRRVL